MTELIKFCRKAQKGSKTCLPIRARYGLYLQEQVAREDSPFRLKIQIPENGKKRAIAPFFSSSPLTSSFPYGSKCFYCLPLLPSLRHSSSHSQPAIVIVCDVLPPFVTAFSRRLSPLFTARHVRWNKEKGAFPTFGHTAAADGITLFLLPRRILNFQEGGYGTTYVGRGG